ncbi:hypothetical protein, partial [Eubacterium sp.]|uniref:hypothetical protein n=1 Tax=Eubacterium sp. TaxID=142586 RepID=UPI0025F83902
SVLMRKLEEEKEKEIKNLYSQDDALDENEMVFIEKMMNKYPVDISLKIFNEVFDQVIEEKLVELNISRPEKTYRFELYARLLFSEKFWNKKVGNDEWICVDEGQDVSYCEYERIIEQNKDNKAFYNVFGDLNQRIKHGRGLVTWEQLKRKLIAHEFDLNENYRNTNQITQYCNDYFDFEMLLTGVEGEPVRNITFDEMIQELSMTKEFADRIAVILPRTMSKQRITRAKILGNNINNISIKFDVSKISVLYVDEVKGIEFDKVYVINQDMEKNEQYISYTRALDKLAIVH